MKKAPLFPPIMLMLAVALLPAGALRAQFLKKLIDNAKQTVQNRANGKADQVTNKALDKVDSSLPGGSKPGTAGGAGTAGVAGGNGLAGLSGQGVDTGSLQRVLGAFAGAAAANPNDTSASDLTMKALGRLVGGGGVSAADSAAAIKSFMSSSGGKGMYYETVTTMTMPGKPVMKDTSNMYLSSGGEGRSEMRLPIPGASTSPMVIIGHAGQPGYSISLDAAARTYSLNVIDTGLINSGIGNYQVTRLGTENVGGYSCVHARMVTTTGSGLFKSTSTMDIWTSTSVPGFALYKRLSSLQRNESKMMAALRLAGCEGYMVKMASQDKNYSMTMLLVRAEERSFQASMFRIPEGYKESDQNFMYQMMPKSK